MALITPGGMVAAASGSLGGTTFSHNRGGMYVRNRSVPTNPNSVFQQAVRSAMTALVARWVETLTSAQRSAWEVYAENVPLFNPLGEPRNVGGIGMYTRSNIPRIQVGTATLPLVDDAPTTYNLGEYTAPTVAAVDATADEVDIGFADTDEWVDETGSSMLVFASRPQNPSINYFKGPYRLAGTVDGDDTTPPTTPASLALPFAVVADQKIFVRVAVARADGRYSTPFRSSGIGA